MKKLSFFQFKFIIPCAETTTYKHRCKKKGPIDQVYIFGYTQCIKNTNIYRDKEKQTLDTIYNMFITYNLNNTFKKKMRNGR